MKRFLLAAMVSLLSLPLDTPAQTAPDARDAVEIQATLDGMQTAWNRHDMTAFVSFMTDDVEWVNVVGMAWRGKAQVFLAHDRMHKTTFKDRQWNNAESTELRQVAPGVVIATQPIPMDGFRMPAGTSAAPSRNMLTLVLVRRDARWLVAEGHNTIIDPQAAAHDPGK